MNDQRARELFLDYHRGSLPAADTAALLTHLAAQPELQREFTEFARTLEALDHMPSPQPSPRLRARVFAAIEAEKRSLRKNYTRADAAAQPATRRSFLWFWLAAPVSACALLALGYLAGARSEAIDSATKSQLADLRHQVDLMNENLGLSAPPPQSGRLVGERPANDRLNTVLVSANLEHPNDKVINELIGSLTLDPSANVRLTALEALYPHAQQEAVRAGVLASLPREQSPIVQVAMIDFLVAARDRDAAPALDQISRNDTTDRSVRDAAKRGLNQL